MECWVFGCFFLTCEGKQPYSAGGRSRCASLSKVLRCDTLAARSECVAFKKRSPMCRAGLGASRPSISRVHTHARSRTHARTHTRARSQTVQMRLVTSVDIGPN